MEVINNKCKYQKGISLKNKTWIHRGGMVEYWLQPDTTEELEAVGKSLYKNKETFVIIGHTSNTYFDNSFDVKYVIDTRHLTSISVLDSDTLVCDCGAPMARVSRYCVENGIAGYEGMVGLPGTVGGGCFCNSGCYGCGIDQVLKYIDLLTEKGEIIRVTRKQMEFSFRSSVLKRGELKGIILRAYFDISLKKDKELLKEIAEKNEVDRKITQDGPLQNLGTTVNVGDLKKNTRNFIIRVARRIRNLNFFWGGRGKRYFVEKILICLLYNRLNILRYISDKRVGCFIWKDDGADKAYIQYVDMMKAVYENCSIEIITLNNKKEV